MSFKPFPISTRVRHGGQLLWIFLWKCFLMMERPRTTLLHMCRWNWNLGIYIYDWKRYLNTVFATYLKVSTALFRQSWLKYRTTHQARYICPHVPCTKRTVVLTDTRKSEGKPSTVGPDDAASKEMMSYGRLLVKTALLSVCSQVFLLYSAPIAGAQCKWSTSPRTGVRD